LDPIRSGKQSEASLQLEAVIQTATDGIIIIDQRGRIEMINEAAARLFKYDLQEMQGQNVSMLMPPPDKNRHDQYISNYLETGKAKIIGIGREVRGRKKDGTTFPLRLSISEVKLEKRIIFTGIVHDLTTEKEAEAALREEKERAQTYFHMANTMNVVLDTECSIVELNQRGCSFLGDRSEDSVRGQNWFALVYPEGTRDIAETAFRQMMAEEIELVDTYESKVVRHDGSLRDFAWKNSLLVDDTPKVVGMISSGIDITERKIAEARIQEMNSDLEKRVDQRTEELASAVNQLLNINKKMEFEIKERKLAEEALRKNQRELQKAFEAEKELSQLKSRFVSMASHEFRTPLSTILSSADLIEAYRQEEQQPKRERHTKRIKSAVSNLTGILNDFLSLSRLEEGAINPNPVDCDLNRLSQEVMDDVQGILKSDQHIVFTYEGPKESVFLDAKMVKNILINLLSNAIKYSEAGKTIDLKIEMGDEVIRLEVTDQGIGIPEEEQQHLFTRFFRAHNVENIQGTGLGLNIVKRYVDLLGGQITFESRLGEGTTFAVRLPKRQKT